MAEQVTKEQLVAQLKDELKEDLSRYDDDFDSWLESALDTPSNTSMEIQRKLVELVGNEEFDKVFTAEILPFMRSLGN